MPENLHRHIRISQGLHRCLEENHVPHIWHVDSNAYDDIEWVNSLCPDNDGNFWRLVHHSVQLFLPGNCARQSLPAKRLRAKGTSRMSQGLICVAPYRLTREKRRKMRPCNSLQKKCNGQGRIRTYVDLRQWVYSPSPLATRAPVQVPAANIATRTLLNRKEAFLSTGRADFLKVISTSLARCGVSWRWPCPCSQDDVE